ncbi:MAG TPA: N-acetylmuramoyl-L-alanine amidase, partial [Terriglobales bacterium]
VAEPEYFEASEKGAGPHGGAATATGVPARLIAATATESQQDLAVSIGNVNGVHVFTHSGTTTVVISLRGEADFTRGAVAERHLIYFDVSTAGAPARAGEPAPALLNVGDGRVAQVRVAKNSKLLTRVVIETAGGARADSGRFYPNPARLVVSVSAGGARAGASVPVTPMVPEVVKAIALPPADSLADGSSSLTRALGLKIGRVVIDPGHGGHDSGTIGPTGIMEKNVVLDVSLRLGKLLRQRLGTQVVFTRDDDTFIPLDERTAIANRDHADLFVSIHANSNPDHQMRGIETYYLDLNNSAQALAVAKRENASGDQDIHELTDMVRKITLNDKMEESHELARDLERSMVDATDEANHGVLTAPFVVLIGAQMPSVLAEITMLSNRSDDRLVSTAAYRQRLALGLYQGIRRYMQSLNGTHAIVAAPSVP